MMPSSSLRRHLAPRRSLNSTCRLRPLLLIIAVASSVCFTAGGVGAAPLPPSPPPPPFKPTGTIMDLIMTSPSYTLLATAIDTVLAPDLVAYLLAPTAGYTFFAPDNAAFEATALLLGLPGGGKALLSDPLLAAVLETQISLVVFPGRPRTQVAALIRVYFDQTMILLPSCSRTVGCLCCCHCCYCRYRMHNMNDVLPGISSPPHLLHIPSSLSPPA